MELTTVAGDSEDFQKKPIISHSIIIKFYFKILLVACIVSIPVSLFIVLISFLPWSNDINNYSDYFNVINTTSILSLSVISFGPFYISYYTYIIRGWKFSKFFILHVVIQTLFWPIIYFTLVAFDIYVWYYYFDFIYFFLGFLPVSIHTAYENISDRNLKFSIKFGISESLVIISALGYTFFLFPEYIDISDEWKIVWRLTLHPFWFQVTMLLPSKIFSVAEISTDEYKGFVTILHAIFHSATIGRMLLSTLDSFYLAILLIAIVNIEEIIFRLTTAKRNLFLVNFIYGKKDMNKIIHGSVVNMEMLFELIGIIISLVMMISFDRYNYLFIFNGGDMESTIYNFIFQLLTEIPTDLLCIIYEIRIQNIDLIDIWDKTFDRKFFWFSVYGFCTMGILGMIYLCELLPRGVYCTDHDILTCTYSPI